MEYVRILRVIIGFLAVLGILEFVCLYYEVQSKNESINTYSEDMNYWGDQAAIYKQGYENACSVGEGRVFSNGYKINWSFVCDIEQVKASYYNKRGYSPQISMPEGCYENETGQDPNDLVAHFTCPDNVMPNWNWSLSSNFTYGIGGSGDYPQFNLTALDDEVKILGENCTAFNCGWWVGYGIDGFYNLSGVYYSDGTLTGMTLQEMESIEEMNSNMRYEKYMNSNGYFYDGKTWHGNGL